MVEPGTETLNRISNARKASEISPPQNPPAHKRSPAKIQQYFPARSQQEVVSKEKNSIIKPMIEESSVEEDIGEEEQGYTLTPSKPQLCQQNEDLKNNDWENEAKKLDMLLESPSRGTRSRRENQNSNTPRSESSNEKEWDGKLVEDDEDEKTENSQTENRQEAQKQTTQDESETEEVENNNQLPVSSHDGCSDF